MLEVLTGLESVGPVCSSAPKATRFFQHIFCWPSQQENESDSEESSDEEVRVEQVPKMKDGGKT